MALFENMAYIFIFGVIAAAFLPATLAEIIGFGGHKVASTVIGSVVGIAILLLAPTAGIPAMIAAAAVSLISSIVLDKAF
ncbi:MAG: hypothetical protein IKS19_00405 [Clostridia bacterium]|nr:hypothetical protein [Clostridia bacterium]